MQTDQVGTEAVGLVTPTVNVNLGGNSNDNGNIGFSDVVKLGKAIYNNTDTNVSLPNFTKSTQISSTVYIQKACAQEDILSDVLQCVQQLYISWILSAVSLNSVIGSTKTKVKDALKVVSTEKMLTELNQPYIESKDIIAGIENFSAFPKMAQPQNNNKPTQIKNGNNLSINSTPDIYKDIKLPVGRVIELKFDGDGRYIINAMVNLYPQFIADEVFRQFFKLGRVKSLAERWFMVKTGEIKFWRDFIFELNEADERRIAMKKDTTGVLRSMLEKQTSGFTKFLQKLYGQYEQHSGIGSASDANRQNIANSVLIFNKPDFTRWCRENQTNFAIENDRNKFMFKTMSMMVVVIDPDFQMVEMYYHGIKNKGEFTFKQIQGQAKTEKIDLAYLMKAFASSNSPRF